MLTSRHAWQPLIDGTRLDERGNVRTWSADGKTVIFDARPRYGHWSYAAHVERMRRKAAVAEFLANLQRERMAGSA